MVHQPVQTHPFWVTIPLGREQKEQLRCCSTPNGIFVRADLLGTDHVNMGDAAEILPVQTYPVG